MARDDTYRRVFGDADKSGNGSTVPTPSAPPASTYDSGEVLWSSPRGLDGAERIRLSRREYLGRAFLDLRVEFRTASGWGPTKKGVSIRIGEIAEMRDALDRALTALAAEGAGR